MEEMTAERQGTKEEGGERGKRKEKEKKKQEKSGKTGGKEIEAGNSATRKGAREEKTCPLLAKMAL